MPTFPETVCGHGVKTFKLKLECGHWSIPLTPAQRAAAESVGMAGCGSMHPNCGVSAIGVGVKVSGKSKTKWERERQEAEERRAAWVPPTTKSLPGGLLVRQLTDDRVQWWCRWCHGKKSGRWASNVHLDDLTADWVAHTATGSHMRERATRDAVVGIIDKLK